MHLLRHHHRRDGLSQHLGGALGVAVRVEALALLVGNLMRTDVVYSFLGDDTQVNVAAGPLQTTHMVTAKCRGREQSNVPDR